MTPRIRHVRLETVIDAPRAACFDLSLSVDAHAASMGPSNERAVAGVMTGGMGLGDTVTWQARHFGLPFRMTSAITEHQPPSRFVDEQQHGPFRRWWHQHSFEPLPSGATRMIDTVEFCSPLGPLGSLVDHLVLSRYLERLLRQRNSWLKATLEGRPR